MFQSSELDNITELFELLQIQSDLWNSKNSTEGECSSKKSTDASSKSDASSEGKDDPPRDKEFLVNLESLLVKKERSAADDDDREEGEIQDADGDGDGDGDADADADDETDCGRVTTRRRSSSNPVNLSLNTKCSDSDASKDVSAEEQETEVIMNCYNGEFVIILTYIYHPQIEHKKRSISLGDSEELYIRQSTVKIAPRVHELPHFLYHRVKRKHGAYIEPADLESRKHNEEFSQMKPSNTDSDLMSLVQSPDNYVVTPHRKRRPGLIPIRFSSYF